MSSVVIRGRVWVTGGHIVHHQEDVCAGTWSQDFIVCNNTTDKSAVGSIS